MAPPNDRTSSSLLLNRPDGGGDDGVFSKDPAYPELSTEIWAAVVTNDGRGGYLRNPDAEGMSKHD